MPPDRAEILVEALEDRVRRLRKWPTIAVAGDAELYELAIKAIRHFRQAVLDAKNPASSLYFAAPEMQGLHLKVLTETLEAGSDLPEELQCKPSSSPSNTNARPSI